MRKYSGKIFILYKGTILDNDGLPEISVAEAQAIAAFCAYVIKFKEALRTNDKATLELSNMLERRWRTLCSQARVPEHISQNEWNEILDAKVNWNRKIYNKSYKPLK